MPLLAFDVTKSGQFISFWLNSFILGPSYISLPQTIAPLFSLSAKKEGASVERHAAYLLQRQGDTPVGGQQMQDRGTRQEQRQPGEDGSR